METFEAEGPAPTRLRRSIAVVVALLALVGVFAVAGTASPAGASPDQTQSCGRDRVTSGGFTHRDGVARISYTIKVRICGTTTGQNQYRDVRMTSTLYDTKCDARSARLRVYRANTTTTAIPGYTNNQGCNTSLSATKTSQTSANRVDICLRANNSTSYSYEDCREITIWTS